MSRFIVEVKEEHIARYEVEAASEDDILDSFDRGEFYDLEEFKELDREQWDEFIDYIEEM